MNGEVKMASLCAPPFPLLPQVFYSLFGKL